MKILDIIFKGAVIITGIFLVLAVVDNITSKRTPTKVITEDNRTFECEFFEQHKNYIQCNKKRMPIQALGIYEVIPGRLIKEKDGN